MRKRIVVDGATVNIEMVSKVTVRTGGENVKFTDNLRNLIDAYGITGAMIAIAEIIECGEDTIDGLSESIKAELGYAGD